MLSDGIHVDLSWTMKGDRSIRSVTNVASLSEVIMKITNFAKDGAGNLHFFKDGIYRPNGEGLIKELYIKVLEWWDRKEDWRGGKGEHIIDYISTQSPTLLDRPVLEKINLLNGIYDWGNEQFLPHDPTYLTTTQIPINYDPSATCPTWDQFLSEVLPRGEQLMVEIIGLCMLPFTGLQKCIILVGSGSNGKSTYLNGLQAAVGVQNISNIPLHTLTNSMEKFAKSQLVGKLVNVFGDLSAKKIEDAANFKPLTGQDRIQIEYKHKQPFSYTPYCKLVFSCNEVMKSDDESEGYRRRFIHIPFTQKFSVDPRKGQELNDALSSPRELSGLFNRIIPRLPSIVDDGFTITEEIAAIIDNWVVMPDSTKLWLTETLEFEDTSMVPARTFYRYYCEKCKVVETLTKDNLLAYVKTLFPRIRAVNRWVDNKQVWVYEGVKVKDPAVHSWLWASIWDESKI